LTTRVLLTISLVTNLTLRLWSISYNLLSANGSA